MAYFDGTCKMQDLFTRIVNDMKAIVDSPWTVYFELSNKIVFKSVGSSGSDVLFTILEPDNSINVTGNRLKISVAEDVDILTGNIPDGKAVQEKYIYCHSSVVDTNLLIDYKASVKADRIVIWLGGDTNSATGLSVLCYTGLLKRYSAEVDSDALCVGVSYQGDNGVRTLRDMDDLGINNVYDAYSTVIPANPGWGNLYHLSPHIMANAIEGCRGELYDIFFIPSAGVTHGDEVQVGATVYKVYTLSVGGSSFLAGATVAVDMS